MQMPAHLMNDGQHKEVRGRSLFADFSSVAEYTGTYTASDYLDIMEHLIQRWSVGSRTGTLPNPSPPLPTRMHTFTHAQSNHMLTVYLKGCLTFNDEAIPVLTS